MASKPASYTIRGYDGRASSLSSSTKAQTARYHRPSQRSLPPMSQGTSIHNGGSGNSGSGSGSGAMTDRGHYNNLVSTRAVGVSTPGSALNYQPTITMNHTNGNGNGYGHESMSSSLTREAASSAQSSTATTTTAVPSYGLSAHSLNRHFKYGFLPLTKHSSSSSSSSRSATAVGDVDGMMESDQSPDEQLFLLRRGAALSDRLLLQAQTGGAMHTDTRNQAAGLGYGSRHRTHFNYLSRSQPARVAPLPSPITITRDINGNGNGHRHGNSIHASALGYGAKKGGDQYFGYLHQPWDKD